MTDTTPHATGMPRLLRVSDVITMTGLSRATIYRDPTFPRPVKLGERSAAWVEAEVRRWVEHRIAMRDAHLGRAPDPRIGR